jgi:hypothetical protein
MRHSMRAATPAVVSILVAVFVGRTFMPALPLRVYADTSVFGGVFDPEFATASQAFFDQVRTGTFTLVTSAIVAAEMQTAPPAVQAFFTSMLGIAIITPVEPHALVLQNAYLRAGVVTAKWMTDALHVAVATVAGCAVIVSWNFKHIVHFQKIPLYNAVNVVNGYTSIAIHSPQEVIRYGTDDDS